MLAPVSPIGTRASPPQYSRFSAPIIVVAADSEPADLELIASLAGRTVAALVISRGEDGRGVIDLGGGRQIAVTGHLPPPGSPVYLKLTSGAAATYLAAEVDEDSTLVDLHADAVSLGRMADTPVTPLQLGRVTAPITQPAQWAAALAAMVQDSGAFYEAHLAAWAQGQYPLAKLRGEPQGAASTDRAGPDQPSAQLTGVTAAAPPVAEEWRTLVRDQLHTLENRALPLAMEAWPGQRADLMIAAEDDPGKGQGGAAAAAGWKTSLKLTLPRLGGVVAQLTLRGDRLWLDLETPSAAAADLFDTAGNALTHALGATGIQLVRTRINHEPG
jgi:hypothetical protein